MKNDNNSSKDNTIPSDNLFMIDSDLLPLFEKARNGCLASQLKLVIAFNDGEGARKNENLTREFEQLIFNTTDAYELKLAALWNPAIREYKKENFDTMIAMFHVVLFP